MLENEGEVTRDAMREFAQKWIEIADTDGNGTIEKQEFLDVVKKINEDLDDGENLTRFFGLL